MDIAALSVAMANQHVRASTGLAIMNKTMGVMEQQNLQLLDMLQTSVQAPHPTLGKAVDIQAQHLSLAAETRANKEMTGLNVLSFLKKVALKEGK